MFSSFDSGTKPSDAAPERFYHGFVLGLVAENANDYILKSNRESGYGRYDVVLEPKNISNPAVIIEFKVFDPKDDENTLKTLPFRGLSEVPDFQLIAIPGTLPCDRRQ